MRLNRCHEPYANIAEYHEAIPMAYSPCTSRSLAATADRSERSQRWRAMSETRVGEQIQVMIRERTLEIQGGNTLLIEPKSSNYLRVGLGEIS